MKTFNNYKKIALSIAALFSFPITPSRPLKIRVKKPQTPEFSYKISGKLKPANSYYGKNISLLNNSEELDQIFHTKHMLDVNYDFSFGDLIVGKLSGRNKHVWGSNEVAPTTTRSTKILNSVGQNHKHFIPRNIFWIREAWLQFSLNDALGLSYSNKPQTLTFGAFPFQVGRGVALGSSFAVGPNFLGFFSDGVVDQYAFGGKLSGNIFDSLSYDIYTAFLNNKSNSLSRTAEKIRGQEYGRLKKPEREFGKINMLYAGRLKWTPVNSKERGKLIVEPYIVYNSDPEQKVEFSADATSKLGTIGLATELVQNRFEFGFDCAVNIGHQKVKGWDRNVIQLQNRNGKACEVNSHVLVGDPINDTNVSSNINAFKAPYLTVRVTDASAVIPSSNAQSLINNAPRSENNNGQSIGIATGLNNLSTLPVAGADVELYNAADRFRDPYQNNYKGWMFITDGCVHSPEKHFTIAATAAYVSGDLDPNSIKKDGDYKGFVGLQETYAGKRVKSAFFLGSAGKLQLPLDTPPSKEQPNRFGAIASGLTNLALVGGGLSWSPKDWKKKFVVTSNVLSYWQTNPDRKFDALNNTTLEEQANSHLGVEVNLFVTKELIKNLKFVSVASVFVPGSHYDDVRGKPMNSNQQKILDRFDPTGFNNEPIPNIGTDVSWTLSGGIEYTF